MATQVFQADVESCEQAEADMVRLSVADADTTRTAPWPCVTIGKC
jgi:hypothetical protein